MNDLTSEQVVGWLRERARLFNQMADVVQNTNSNSLNLEIPTPEAVRNLLVTTKKRMRVATIAKHLNADPLDIHKILQDPNNGLTVGARGWVSVKPLETLGT